MANREDRAFYLLAFRMIGDFGATIAIPAVLAAWIGTRLDARYATKPWLTFACLIVAFLLTMLVVRKKAVAYGKEYQSLIDRSVSSPPPAPPRL